MSFRCVILLLLVMFTSSAYSKVYNIHCTKPDFVTENGFETSFSFSLEKEIVIGDKVVVEEIILPLNIRYRGYEGREELIELEASGVFSLVHDDLVKNPFFHLKIKPSQNEYANFSVGHILIDYPGHMTSWINSEKGYFKANCSFQKTL